MTGNLTLVLYEDPEDGIPKIHVRSSRYMAWIAEMMLPSHLHVNKVRKWSRSVSDSSLSFREVFKKMSLVKPLFANLILIIFRTKPSNLISGEWPI